MSQSYSSIIFWIGVILLARLIIFFFKEFSRKKRFFYKSKGPYLLSKGEKIFFDVLVQSISSDLYVCPKVRVADLIEVNLPRNDKRFWSSFNKISKKHVDFVLCKRSDFTPKLVIELDGGSHKTRIRSQRDVFVNESFSQADIPVLHVQIQDSYDISQIMAQIKSY